jgi:hypothetical protein
MNQSLVLLLVLTVLASHSFAQQPPTNVPSTNVPARLKNPGDVKFKHDSFTFVRIRYSEAGRFKTWFIDYPDADLNFSARFAKETGLKTNPTGKVLQLTNAELNQYPFIYIVEGGDLRLSDAEAKALRAYLLAGGFLMVDDFWGELEWKNLAAQMKRVFPDREPVDLDIKHPIFHSWYDLHAKPQVPNVGLGVQSQFHGRTWEREDAKEPHYRALLNDAGGVMAIFCHNTDLGDGWEREGENEYYVNEFSLKKAYPMGINIVVYALTH